MQIRFWTVLVEFSFKQFNDSVNENFIIHFAAVKLMNSIKTNVFTGRES